MSKRSRRIKKQKKRRTALATRNDQQHGEQPRIIARAMDIPQTLNESERSVEIIAATEKPVDEYDWGTNRVWSTVLLISGARTDKKQIPLLNNHDRWSVNDQLGSALDPQIRNDEKLGPTLVYRAQVSEAEKDVWTKIREGHLRRVSVGRADFDTNPTKYDQFTYVPDDETLKLDGRTWKGPLKLVTDWDPKEVSFTVLNADEDAVVRSDAHNNSKTGGNASSGNHTNRMEEDFVDEKLRKLLIERGMPKDLDDKQAQVFLLGNLSTRNLEYSTDEAALKALKDKPTPAAAASGDGNSGEETVDRSEGNDSTNRNKVDSETVIRAERDRVLNIRSACEMQNIPAEFSDDLIDRGVSMVEANQAIREWRTKNTDTTPVPTSVEITRSEVEKIAPHIVDGLSLRAEGMDASRVTHGRKDTDLSPEAYQYARMRLPDLAKRCLEANSISTQGRPESEICELAMRMDSQGLGLAYRSENGHFVSPSTLPGLLLETGNRALLRGFTEADTRWREWVEIGDPVNDFRPIAMHNVDDGGELDMIPDDEEIPHDRPSETKETASAELYGRGTSYTYRALINDDLGFITRRLSKRGRWADRTINRSALSVLSGNPVLGNDNKAIFHADHKNIVGSGGTPSIAQLSSMRKLFRAQTGIGSDAKLNIPMKHLIVPNEQETNAEVVIFSGTDPTASNDRKYNPFANKANLIVEPDLDATSTLKYWGVADYRDQAFLMIRFMRGQENPILQDTYNPKTMGRDYTVHQTWVGVFALGFRGAVENPGA